MCIILCVQAAPTYSSANSSVVIEPPLCLTMFTASSKKSAQRAPYITTCFRKSVFFIYLSPDQRVWNVTTIRTKWPNIDWISIDLSAIHEAYVERENDNHDFVNTREYTSVSGKEKVCMNESTQNSLSLQLGIHQACALIFHVVLEMHGTWLCSVDSQALFCYMFEPYARERNESNSLGKKCRA